MCAKESVGFRDDVKMRSSRILAAEGYAFALLVRYSLQLIDLPFTGEDYEKTP